MPASSEGSRLTWLGQLVVLLFVIAGGFGAWKMFVPKPIGGGHPGAPSQPSRPLFGGGDSTPVEIGIAYGTEKQRWMEWAVQQFAQTPEGKRIKVNLIPKGSLESAQAILNGDQKI